MHRRLRIRKERLSGVAILPQPCLLCGGPEETPVHMHVGCPHSRLLWPHYRQTVQEAARHLPPGDEALLVASWRSAGAEWTEVFSSGLVFEAAAAQLRTIARYDLPGETSVDEFLQHMLQLGDFVWELRNHQLERLLRAHRGAAAQVHRWLTGAEGDCSPPPPRPGRDFAGSLCIVNCIVNGNLECPPQEDAHPYRDLPGGFSKQLQAALFTPWIIRCNSMTTWEAHIVGAEWAREWSRWCATTRAETPVPQYAAVPLKGRGPNTRPRATMIHGAGPDHPWDAADAEWLRAVAETHAGWGGDVSSLIRAPLPPRLVLQASNMLQATEIHTWGCDTATIRWLSPEDGGTPLTVAHFKDGGPTFDDAMSRLGNLLGPLLPMLRTDLTAALRRELDGCNGLRMGWEAVADGTQLALLHRDAADGCRWDALVPHLNGHHAYMTTPPEGISSRPGMTSSQPSMTTGFLADNTWQAVRQKTLGRDYQRRVRARLLELWDPLHQRWDDLWLGRLDP